MSLEIFVKKLIKESKSGSVSEAVSGYRFGHVAVSVSQCKH